MCVNDIFFIFLWFELLVIFFIFYSNVGTCLDNNLIFLNVIKKIDNYKHSFNLASLLADVCYTLLGSMLCTIQLTCIVDHTTLHVVHHTTHLYCGPYNSACCAPYNSLVLWTIQLCMLCTIQLTCIVDHTTLRIVDHTTLRIVFGIVSDS